jgi:hexosaminidase
MKYTSRIQVGILGLLAALNAFAVSTNRPAIIPLPENIEARAGVFKLRSGTRILVDSASQDTGEFLAQRLRTATGYKFSVSSTDETEPAKHAILLATGNVPPGGGTESYQLTVAPDSIIIRGPSQAGLFWGVQSLLQLLPPEAFAAKPVKGMNRGIPCFQIEDQPRFPWRGFMLDVSRHFYTKAEIEKFLDLMALYKLNMFHWHLVDGDGWRIEIKRYPRLTGVGAWRNGIGHGLDPKSSTAYGPDGRYGGFYTQTDIREVVAYAQARHITIVPEIEMPGHSRAALSAYPELSCTGGPYSTDPDKVTGGGVYCAGKDESFEFLQNVLTEVFDLFPGKYIHIGGDEVNKSNWKKCALCQARIKAEGLKSEEELQSYFIRRMEKFINAHGRTLIGWSEICQGGLAKNAVVMDWIGGGLEAAEAGHDVVMTTEQFCYLDHWQSTNRVTEPCAFGGVGPKWYLPLPKIYAFEPVPANLAPSLQSHILGAQGNLWTELVASMSHAEYMVFPRLCALAEVTWSPKESRNYEDFRRRLEPHLKRFDCLGVNYRKYPLVASE